MADSAGRVTVWWVTAAGSSSAGRWSLDCAAFIGKVPPGGRAPGVQAQEHCRPGTGPRLWVAGSEPTLLGMSFAGGRLVLMDIDRHAAHAMLFSQPCTPCNAVPCKVTLAFQLCL